ncbi:uncharacterized protein TNCV_3663101 [Trichonephila clavipes]|nr:uncharacterized protein TNCV_3663101 [Trichonephila clavipes]
MLDVTKYPPNAHGFTCRNCGGGDRGRVAIYRPFGEVSLSLNRTVTCMVLKANDRRTSCPCHDEFRGPRSDYVRQQVFWLTTGTSRWSHLDKPAADRPDYRHQEREVLPESTSPAHYLTSEERRIPPRKSLTQVEVCQGYILCLSGLLEAPEETLPLTLHT